MRKQSPLESLAEQICSAAKAITVYCQSNDHPHPSFDGDSTIETLPSSAPQDILSARQTIVEAALKIQQLATEPNQYLPCLAVHVRHSCLHHSPRSEEHTSELQ